ncbi:flagellar basal body P-ring protein FlgI [Hydrogenimonas urashimensis]|uniref:flagellar basal body P-ring protein FlgI n=1 Tax=Hydrogenimonas urashimensis TaxID=2740515 RepID=UPI001916C243|nr:flagellar basal body P-ring protein FlgI [Hydrogenimonas urashimensis]
MRRAAFLIVLLPLFLHAAKIKEICNVIGVRDNQLIGYGLVVGLNKTGDGTTSKFTLQTIANMLQSMNVKLDPKDIKSKNVAAVMVTATLPPFARQGDRIDVVVSSMGDAKSIEGGTLLMTPLKGVDGRIYALAQGSVTIGGRNGRGAGTLNHATAGRIPGGALVEQEVAFDLYSQKQATLSLKEANFKNAIAIQKMLNRYYKQRVAVAIDARTIRLKKPETMSMIEFLAEAQELSIDYSVKPRIVIDERTGTIVSGVDIEVEPVMITHGDIVVKIERQKRLPAIKKGSDAVNIGRNTQIQPGNNAVVTRPGATTVANIARSLKKLGATPKDIISILEAMKNAGAIHADLQII